MYKPDRLEKDPLLTSGKTVEEHSFYIRPKYNFSQFTSIFEQVKEIPNNDYDNFIKCDEYLRLHGSTQFANIFEYDF